MFKKILFLCLLMLVFLANAEEYQSTDNFLQQVFSAERPKAKVLWIKKEMQKTVAEILKHKPRFMRIRYWELEGKTVWVINETGKIKPITVAVLIQNNKIQLLKVLAFRESRGWEVKHDFFTDQFKNNKLDASLKLVNSIDGISGATLSVRALTKVAQLALYFNSQIK